MQTDDENEYHIRSALSNTGIPTEHHRTMGCDLLMSNAIIFGKLIYSRARSPVGKSWLWPTIIANERRGNHPIEYHEILVICYKKFVFPWFVRKKKKKKMTNWSYVVCVYQLYCVLIVMLHKWASVEKALNPHTRNLQQTHRRSGWLSATCTDLWTRAIARTTQSVTDRARERDILVKRKDVSKRYSHIYCLPKAP